MTLRDQIAEDVDSVFLNEDDFAEEIRYTPVGGVGRDITAVVIRRPSPIRSDANHLTHDNAVDVCVKRSSTTGVSEPKLGDSIVWSSQIYSFVEIVSEDSDGLMLRFANPKTLNAGPQNRFRL